MTFLGATRPCPVASCWLTGGDAPASGVVSAVAPDRGTVGTPRASRAH
jgi:hypothetical protein